MTLPEATRGRKRHTARPPAAASALHAFPCPPCALFPLAHTHSLQNVDREPVFCPELGLAVERMRDGFTVEHLWNVL